MSEKEKNLWELRVLMVLEQNNEIVTTERSGLSMEDDCIYGLHFYSWGEFSAFHRRCRFGPELIKRISDLITVFATLQQCLWPNYIIVFIPSTESILCWTAYFFKGYA